MTIKEAVANFDYVHRHGPIVPCNTRTASSILTEYLNLPEDSPRRLIMERNMGRANLHRMIKQNAEDELNRKYLEESTTGCPHCGVRCEKSHGKIICTIAMSASPNGTCFFQDATM